MKILWVGMYDDYGDSNRGTSFEYNNFYQCIINMSDVKVVHFDFVGLAQNMGVIQMSDLLWEACEFEKPDILFSCLYKKQFDPTFKSIQQIGQQTKVITYNWFSDDHWRYDNFSKEWAKYYSYISTTHQKSFNKYCQDGFQDKIIMTQWACNHFIYKKLNLPKTIDVSFCGQLYGERQEIIQYLQDNGIQIKCFGHPFNYLTFEPMLQVLNQTKINLNITNAGHGKDRQIKGRNFEIPGIGSFLLTDYAEGLENYYDLEKEMIIFKNKKDLLDKIKYYLEHEKEREEIAQKAMERTLKEHTYEMRFNQIFEEIKRREGVSL